MSLPKHVIKTPLLRLLLIALLVIGIISAFAVRGRVFAQLDTYPIYQNSLSADWTNWSWGGSPQFGDKISISFNPWGGLYLHANAPIDTKDIKFFQFRMQKPETSKFRVFFFDASFAPIDNQLDIAHYGIETRDSMHTYKIPAADLRLEGRSISGFAIQEVGGAAQYVQFDDIVFLKEQPIANGMSRIFTDNDGANWDNWSWGGDVVMNDSISMKANTSWSGMYLRRKEPIPSEGFTQLSFTAQFSDPSQYQVALFGPESKPLAPFSVLSLYKTADRGNGFFEYIIPSSVLTSGNGSIQGIVVQDISGSSGKIFALHSISLLRSQSPVIAAPSLTPTKTVSADSSYQQGQAPVFAPDTNGFSTGNNSIYKNAQKIIIKGVNWFGFETETYAPHGLWSRNWKEMIAQMKQSGFNSVRVPFCPQTLRDVAVSGIDAKLNPDLVGMTSLKLMDTIVTEMSNQGLYVLLDHHRPDCQAISELWYTGGYSEEQWIKDLTFLAARYKNLENFLGLDIKNEPHGKATWGTGNTATDWNIAAEKAGRAILGVNSKIVIFVEGVQENPTCSGNIGHWMGGNMEPINCKPLDTASIPANKLVLSPHVYGPDVYPQGYFSEGNFPQNMPAIWDQHFGNLAGNYTVIPGEWGGKYGWEDVKDKIWQDAMANYFVNKRICSSYYWSWNPNSGDTGGILQDDWTSIRQDKLELLSRYWSQCN